jgi:hypothetical protein
LNDTNDVQYGTNVTLNGQQFQVLIDTGSSDLWVAGTVPNAGLTGLTSGVTYAVGEVQGPIKTATLEFAGYSITDQAYLEITPSQDNPEGSGLIGLGPNVGSNILAQILTTAGNPPLDRIFAQNLSTPNFLSILLARSNDPDEPFPGDLTVGEILSGYEAITTQPKLNNTGQHWQVLLDQNGIIGPDGKFITVNSQVEATTDPNRATVVFDSGFSLPQVPKSVSDALYSGVSGAEFINTTNGGLWLLPCDEEINFSFVFGGVKIPIHPLDANMDGTALGVTYDNGTIACFGPFQPVSFDSSFGTGQAPTFDMILGMAFLRNAYLLVDYGDFVNGTTTTTNPYMQLLSTTNDSAAAHEDFVKVRLNSTSQAYHNSTSAIPPKVKSVVVIAAAIGVGFLALLTGVCFCCLRKRRGPSKGLPGGFGGQAYRPLNEPAPYAAVETHAMPNLNYNSGQGPPAYGGSPPQQGSQQQYQTAWDHRY